MEGEREDRQDEQENNDRADGGEGQAAREGVGVEDVCFPLMPVLVPSRLNSHHERAPNLPVGSLLHRQVTCEQTHLMTEGSSP